MSIQQNSDMAQIDREQHDATQLIEIKVGEILKRPGAYLTNPGDALFAVSALVRTTKNPWMWFHAEQRVYIAELENMGVFATTFTAPTLEHVACLAIIEIGKTESGFFTVDEEGPDEDA